MSQVKGMSAPTGVPYDPSRFHVGGIYAVFVGDLFYLGSTRKLGSRNSDHRTRLEQGIHPNPLLQEAFNAGGSYSMVILKLLPEKPEEPAADYRTRREMWEQVELDRWFGKPGCANRSENSGYNTGNGEIMRRMWQDPVFREAQMVRLKARKGDAISAETRKRMSDAKRGRRNPKATPCKVGDRRFDSATEAARAFGVPQQVMHLWLTGAVPWPGTGPRAPRRKDLIGLTGHFLS